jgi:hypothetical protein
MCFAQRESLMCTCASLEMEANTAEYVSTRHCKAHCVVCADLSEDLSRRDVGFSCVVHESSERRVSRTISAAMLFTSKDFAAGADGGSIAASLTPYR